MTLSFLATSKTFQSLSFQYHISDQEEVFNAILKNLVPLYLKVPSTEEEWLSIAGKFKICWQYPNVIGAINGKHMIIRKPSHGGSYYYNYKHSNSIILMAIAGPSYECLYVDVGTNGRVIDVGVWNKWIFSKALEN